jgi:hypothetical protein
MLAIFILPRGCGSRLVRESHASVVSDVFCKLPGSGRHRLAVVTDAQEGHHRAAGISCSRIINNWFEAISNFNTVFPLVR